MYPPVHEGQAGSRDKVSHRAGHQHFPGCGDGSDARGEVDGYPRHATSDQLAFSGVETSTDGEPDSSHGVTDGGSAPDRTRRAVERCEEAVSRGIDLAAPKALQLPAHDSMMPLEQLTPSAVAHLGCPGSGVDDIGE